MYRLFHRQLSNSTKHNKQIIREACRDSASNVTDKPSVVNPSSQKIESHVYCINHVKKYDRENYLAALCIDHDLVKRGIFALRAFNVELSLVRDSTTNSDRAKLRLNFWSKLIDEIVRRNEDLDPNVDKLMAYYNYTPVAKELLEIFHFVDLDDTSHQKLRDLIGSRLSSKVLGYKPFEDIKDLELYCSKSNGSIYHLSVELMIQLRNFWPAKESFSDQFDNMSENLGKAQGLSNIIRGIRYNSTKNCCYIPKDLLAAHGLTTRDFTGSRLNPVKIKPVVEELATRSQQLVRDVYKTSPDIPDAFKAIFLPCITIQSYLKKLRKCNYDISDPSLSQRDKYLPFNLWVASKFFRTPLL